MDGAAAILGLCYERTYEGEAAMKLESAAVNGEDALRLEPTFSGSVLNTTEPLFALYENRDRIARSDLAYSVHAYLAKGLALLACEKATEAGIDSIGFTGGSAVNALLASIMRRAVENAGLRFLVHEAVPAGDGGISFGQAVVGGFADF